jgi:hypothetical protein
MKTAPSPIKEMFVVVTAQGKHRTNLSTGTKVYIRKKQAIGRCPAGGRVLRFDTSVGEVIHEEPTK